jgi:lipopolysaccharide export system permease protein
MPLLQKYVFLELVKAFSFLLSGLTVLLMFVGVVGEAAKSGLGPMQVLEILPYIVPSLLPFTIPATLLLTVCVVYGRLAGDQEITAVKAAGISVMALIWPSFCLGGILSICTLLLTDQFIPWARANIQQIVTLKMEDIFLDILRTQGQVVDPRNGITVTVMEVRGKTLIKPTFRYAFAGGAIVTMQAREATLEFDLERQEVVLHLLRPNFEHPNARMFVNDQEEIRFPLPRSTRNVVPRELTIRDIRREMELIAQKREDLEQRRILATAIALSRGDFERFLQPDFQFYEAHIEMHTHRYNRLHTEIHSRYALSCSCLFFVILGSPFSILQARRQFLTSFALCFFPIFLGYYPVVMGCMTLAKNYAAFHPAWTMWLGNGGMLLGGGCVLWRLLRN